MSQRGNEELEDYKAKVFFATLAASISFGLLILWMLGQNEELQSKLGMYRDRFKHQCDALHGVVINDRCYPPEVHP